MLKNYITIAINNLLKNKLYSAINIIGLAVGLAACILIALYVQDQYSYDTQWNNSDRIYRVNFYLNMPGQGPSTVGYVPSPAMSTLERYFKDKIEKSSRIFPYSFMFGVEDSKFEESLIRVDPAFIEMFQLEVLAGSLEDTFSKKGQIALSEETAKRCFGDQNPIGKTITLSIGEHGVDYPVTAVYRIPGNSVLDIPALSLLDYAGLNPFFKSWDCWEFKAYFQLKEDIDIETLKPLTPALIDREVDSSQFWSDPELSASDVISVDFQNIENAHFNSPWDLERSGGNKTVVNSFAAISLLVLVIGCINFIILTTAKATQRAREVALRKVAGAKRKQLIVQFLGESTFIVFLAMILSMGVIEIMLPIFESMVGKTLFLDYTSPSIFIPLIALFLIVSISGGLYPAFILSGFRPGNILKTNQSKETTGSMTFRNVLVVFQFSVSIILIISTCVIFAQLQYNLNRNPGYNKDNLLIINGLGFQAVSREKKISVLKQELLNLPDISDVGTSFLQPSETGNYTFSFSHQNQPGTSNMIQWTGIGHDYFKTYQIPIVAGREFSVERDTPDLFENESGKLMKRNIIINESAVRQLGFANAEEAVGRVIHVAITNVDYAIIGVVADNNLFSIRDLPGAVTYHYSPDVAVAMTVRFQGSPLKILKQVKSVWENVTGNRDISTVFANQLIAAEFQQEQKEVKVIVSFSLLAIIIACMGLFGSASFAVDQRTKEIGLRKVMGAKVKNIVSLMLWQFSKPVLIANIIAWPVAIYAMQSWLERFPYRFNPLLMIPICLVSGLIALVIAWFTVAGNTRRVAKSKPIKALRYE
jgi:putative ABC transport system permease protein